MASSPFRWLAALLLVRISAAQFCNTQQDFSEERFLIHDLHSGIPANDTLCPQHWVWYRMRTKYIIEHTQLSLSVAEQAARSRRESQANLSICTERAETRGTFSGLL